MEFSLNDEQQLLQETFREYAETVVKPIAAEIDEEERFPQEIIPVLAEVGFFGIPVPEEYGGVGVGHLEYAIAVEELAKVCASTAVTVSAHTSLCTWPILHFGNDAQKEKYIPDLASGAKLGAFGLTEPNAGTDASGQKTVAKLEGDYYVLNGSKCFITNGYYADTYVVFAMTDKEKGNKGISAFILEKGMEGFEFGNKERKMGIRASSTYELIFKDVKVPKENLLGNEGDGFKIAMATLDGGRIGIASQALGIAEGALAEAVEYVKQREQFGKPIASYQYTQFRCADLKARIEAAKLLVYKAAWKKDQGLPYSEDAAIAKLYASETSREVTWQAVQMFGGYGYTRDYPVERMMRDAKITEIYEGTSEVQRMVIAAKMGLK